jgi:hypothetical protein
MRSNARKDLQRLIKAACKEGAQQRRLPNGHIQVINPANGLSVQVSWSPKDPRSYYNARASLRRIGLCK